MCADQWVLLSETNRTIGLLFIQDKLLHLLFVKMQSLFENCRLLENKQLINKFPQKHSHGKTRFSAL